MSDISVTPLGAGQDVGRSCILVSIGGKNIMLDCGMHMGYQDERRFPDFSYICDGDLTTHVDCVIISHFHLDHCGALPYMTEMVGYRGPIYMTQPTKALCPILLEDMRKVAVERKGETNFFTSAMIKDCIRKVRTVALHETVQVDDTLSIKAYYAGHVLGAAMFRVCVGDRSLVYTGDYNMTPDRHLGAARIDKCRPDVLITESTYATTIRDSKRCRERDFLKKIHACVEAGGKVLIPVFALGRVQELCILLDTYWDRMNIKCPVYFTMGLAEAANKYYRMFIPWTNQKIRQTFVSRNMFDFKHITAFDKAYLDAPGPMVVFATPGMLHAGLSLSIFKKWAPYEANMVIMPGYCVQGTVGHKVINGAKMVEIERQNVPVKLTVEYMSFSAHADAKGITQLIRHCQPSNVLLVHGENEKMDFLKRKITQEFGIGCYKPANGETAVIPVAASLPVRLAVPLLAKPASNCLTGVKRTADGKEEALTAPVKRCRLVRGVLTLGGGEAVLAPPHPAPPLLPAPPHTVRYTQRLDLPPAPTPSVTHRVYTACVRQFPGGLLSQGEAVVSVGDVLCRVTPSDHGSALLLSYTHQDEALGCEVTDVLKKEFNL